MSQNVNAPKQFSAASRQSSKDWLSATGPLPIPMTNDYLFRAILQNNNYVLKGLICSLFCLSPAEVTSATIINPILLGEAINEKTFFLDIFVLLNNDTRINLELQVINEHNWPERSLSYLCRTFDNLNAGEDYRVVRPAIQIGLLDFTLFPAHPEFYSTYKFMNIKNHTIYSDKICLSVLDLTRKDLATEEDQKSHRHLWASFFKAKTWEELKMLARQDEFINEASAAVYQLSRDEQIRLQCEAREDYYRRQRSVQHDLDKQKHTIETQNATIENQNTTIENQNTTIEKITKENISLKKKVTSQEEKITSQGEKIISLQEELTSLRKEVTSLTKLLSDSLN